ncbi:MAG: hypothetical protein V4537_09915 [Pseudomonadota bacterium]|uniref:hypothetical protein n=1 Tax=Sphingomonas sp. TaxID=28214 RepID=UPI001AC9DFF1|nr:hypothetical protein [Sphingomonas sp.]MBN8848065.1 hypothetical protein [Sphingomonas sp.]
MISVTAKASVPNTESSIEKNKMPAIIKKKTFTAAHTHSDSEGPLPVKAAAPPQRKS